VESERRAACLIHLKCWDMPTVTSLEALERAAAEFEVGGAQLVIEPPALTAARQSLDFSGLLLLGEVHGVRENPLVIRALMLALGLSGLALEWPDELTPLVGDYLAGNRWPTTWRSGPATAGSPPGTWR
jgi:hypothetical protein